MASILAISSSAENLAYHIGEFLRELKWQVKIVDVELFHERAVHAARQWTLDHRDLTGIAHEIERYIRGGQTSGVATIIARTDG